MRRAGFRSDADLSEPDVRALFHVRPVERLRVMPGRETFLADVRPAGCVVVKRAERDAWREAWHERLQGRAPRSPGRREFEALVALEALVRVPKALAWCEDQGGRSLVVMERVVHAETLRERAARADAAERRVLARDLLELVVRLHTRGWIHRDLYLQHVLVREREAGAELVLIDVGRARHSERTGRRWFVKDVAALAHSTPASVPLRDRLRFLAAYLDGVGVTDRAARRRFARDVEQKRARMAAHVPLAERPRRGADAVHASEARPSGRAEDSSEPVA